MFYLIDKPSGVSSFWVIRQLRKKLNVKKMWHTGTLDPLATWCLLIATEKSTKLIPLLESSKKEYITTIRFDGTSESYDTEMPITPIDVTGFKWKSESEIIDFLLWQKDQTPPKYSAIHINGKRSYEIARKWKDFHIEKRPIKVFEADIIEKWNLEIKIRLKVSSGCYIRSFWPLLWEFFGVEWWYLTQLRRISIDGENFHCQISECSNIENPSPISLNSIFHTIHTYEWSIATMNEIIHWKKITKELLPSSIKEDEIFFIRNMSIPYFSLCKKIDWEIQILKNDIN